MTNAICTFTVKDASTGAPVSGANCTLTVQGIGTYSGFTDNNGLCVVSDGNLVAAAISWAVSKSGYIDATGQQASSFQSPNYAPWTVNVSLVSGVAPPPVTYLLAITASAGGTTSPSPSSLGYAAGNVSVTAIPNSGYVLDHWELDGVNVGASNPYIVTMNANHSLNATFKLAAVNVAICTFTVKDASTGAPVSGANCAFVQSGVTYNGFTDNNGVCVVSDGNVLAAPISWAVSKSGYIDATGQQASSMQNPNYAPWTVNASLVPVTAPPSPTYALSISVLIGGTTSPAPGTYQYSQGTVVNVAPIPESNYRFVNWKLDGQVTLENPINVTMNMDHMLAAIFETLPPPSSPQKCYLTISSINGLTNPAAGTYETDIGASITVACTPNSNYRFKEWLLDNVSVSTSLSYTVVMDANHGLVAVCEAISPTPLPILTTKRKLLTMCKDANGKVVIKGPIGIYPFILLKLVATRIKYDPGVTCS